LPGFWDRVGAGFGQYRRTERQQCGSGCDDGGGYGDVGEYESRRAFWSSAGALGRADPNGPGRWVAGRTARRAAEVLTAEAVGAVPL